MNWRNALKFWKSLRDEAKWWTLVTSLIFVVTDILIEGVYISYPGYIRDNTPPIVRYIWALSGLLALLLAILSFPRWYSFVAIASWLFVLLIIMGR
ncbi:MAG: hypothetical protein AUG51_24490 [Acidobacteria bacterium 13_1_20CM_3_53_8]|nr:MAG: hypothetical protein AUG51_24490 [Acidobacteria bacterium 13_1_20CM_3_53_8]